MEIKEIVKEIKDLKAKNQFTYFKEVWFTTSKVKVNWNIELIEDLKNYKYHEVREE